MKLNSFAAYFSNLPPDPNPLRRLAAAVALRAVQDYINRPRTMTLLDEWTLKEFVTSEHGLEMIAEFSQIPKHQVPERLEKCRKQ